MKYLLLFLDRCLSIVVHANRHLHTISTEDVLPIIIVGNVSIARWVIPLVMIPLLDFVMIH